MGAMLSTLEEFMEFGAARCLPMKGDDIILIDELVFQGDGQWYRSCCLEGD